MTKVNFLQFSVTNEIVNHKKGHSIVNNSFARKPDGLLDKTLREVVYSKNRKLTCV